MRRWLTIIRQGWRLLRACTPKGRLLPTRDYVQWRLGTVYGSFCTPDGKPLTGPFEGQPFRYRTVWELLGCAIDDWPQVQRFLFWLKVYDEASAGALAATYEAALELDALAPAAPIAPPFKLP